MGKLILTKPPSEVVIQGPIPSKSGGQIWRLRSSEATTTIATSASSTDALLAAKQRRDKVLFRLAKR